MSQDKKQNPLVNTSFLSQFINDEVNSSNKTKNEFPLSNKKQTDNTQERMSEILDAIASHYSAYKDYDHSKIHFTLGYGLGEFLSECEMRNK